jgi:hypothetical protein
VAPSQPDDELELLDFDYDCFSNDSEIDEWNEAFIADVEAEVTEE